MTGKIASLEGRAELVGRKFELTRGEVSWAGGEAPDDPRLELRALWDNTQEQVKVHVHVSGTARKPRIELSSDPPLDDAQIATLLATGRRELRRGATAAAGGAAASVLTNTAAERLRQTIATALPLDRLQVEVGENGFQATRVEAGTHLFDKFYVGYRRNFGAETRRDENTNEVRAEYEVSPHVTLESEYGDANSGGLSVFYVRDY